MQSNTVHNQWYEAVYSIKALDKDDEHWQRKTDVVAFVPTSLYNGNVKWHPEAESNIQ